MKWYFETNIALYTHFCEFHGLDVDETDSIREFLRVVGTNCLFTIDCLPNTSGNTYAWFQVPQGAVLRYSPTATLMDLYARW